jgi:hypothetical protein
MSTVRDGPHEWKPDQVGRECAIDVRKEAEAKVMEGRPEQRQRTVPDSIGQNHN